MKLKIMKKLLPIFLAIFMNLPLQAIVKTFVNDSNKTFFVRIYDEKKKNIIAITLEPGEVREVFIPYDIILKIIIQDERHSVPLKTMAHHILHKSDHPFNDNMVLIIHKNASVSMYKGGNSSKNKALQQIDHAYKNNLYIPGIDVSINTTKSDQTWAKQTVDYKIRNSSSAGN